MVTIVEYDFRWDIEELTSRDTQFYKECHPPNTKGFAIFIVEQIDRSKYSIHIKSFSEEKVKVKFHYMRFKSASQGSAGFGDEEIYTLVRNVPQHMATFYLYGATLRVSCEVIPFLHDFLLFTCDLKVYVPNDPKERIVPISSAKRICLCSDFKRLYDSKDMSDVTIVIGKETLLAHKLVLVARSPVFRAMMDNDWLESSTKTLQVTDIDLHGFDCFLKYLYSSEIEDKSYAAVRNLFMLADKYQVDALKAECRDIFNVEMKVENVFQVLELAHLCTDDALKQIAIQFIGRHFSQVCKMQEWINICKNQCELASDVFEVLTISFNK